MYEYFRGFTNVSGPAGRGLRRYAIADDRLEATLQPHIDEVAGVGTEFS